MAKLGETAFDQNDKVSAEFFALSYGALVRQLIDQLPQDEDVNSVNQQLEMIGQRIGARLVEEYSVRSGGPPCKTFTDCAESVTKIGLKMFLNVNATVSAVKDSADTFSIRFHDNPLNIFVELPPEKNMRERLWYSNVLCGVLKGALGLVGYQTDVHFMKDTLRGDPVNEITLRFIGKERETFVVDREGR
ncbi:trafficking protein particle complex subunit-like protein [Angomonas deanei]|nr:trafficking protein particle complex subunit-like protein [Angomonas deanei]|eukprot:EPY38660.1 trafficking protein particle complex subunit-like protein [Angomonas deanei]